MSLSAARVASFFVLVGLLLPARSDAGILSWLDKLSGPGPFWSVEVNYAAKCFPRAQARKPKGPNQMAVLLPGAVIPCDKKTLEKGYFSWYVTLGVGLADENPLDYGDRFGDDVSDRVAMLKLGTALDRNIGPALDLGVGAGFRYFAGPRFENFALPYVQPVRITLRPLLETRFDWLLISANWDILVGVVDGARFGAPVDPFRAKNENNLELGISIDLRRLNERLK